MSEERLSRIESQLAELNAEMVELRAVVNDDHRPRIVRLEVTQERLLSTTSTTLLVVGSLERLMKKIAASMSIPTGDEITK